MNNKSLILVYMAILLAVTYIRQEFIFIPKMSSLDFLEDGQRVQFIENFYKLRWTAFVMVPVQILLRLLLVSMCLYIGSYFFTDYSGQSYSQWWRIAVMAQAVPVLYTVLVCGISLAVGPDNSSVVIHRLSLQFIGDGKLEGWLNYPLTVVSIGEVLYWLLMAGLVSRKSRTPFGKSFGFTMSTYGVGLLVFTVLVMFLGLYLEK